MKIVHEYEKKGYLLIDNVVVTQISILIYGKRNVLKKKFCREENIVKKSTSKWCL